MTVLLAGRPLPPANIQATTTGRVRRYNVEIRRGHSRTAAAGTDQTGRTSAVRAYRCLQQHTVQRRVVDVARDTPTYRAER
jgi:hypothetical protein